MSAVAAVCASSATCSMRCLRQQQPSSARLPRVGRVRTLRMQAVLTKEKQSLDITKMAPLGDRVLVKPLEDKPESTGGVLLPSSATKTMGDALLGEVVAVGDDVDLGVKVGDTIVYQKYSSADVETGAGDLTFVAAKSVLATLA